MKINLVVPKIDKDKFTGGVWCLFQYANGLAERGHEVRIVSLLPVPEPSWFPAPHRFVMANLSSTHATSRRLIQALGPLSRASVQVARGKAPAREARVAGGAVIDELVNPLHRLLPYELYRAVCFRNVRRSIEPADATIATHFETAVPVALYGSGKLFYFAQHFEPYFSRQCLGAEYSELEAKISYRLGLSVIANSSWLKQEIEKETGGQTKPVLCHNAINHEFFHSGKIHSLSSDSAEVRILSYGGRGVDWKGFKQMAEAMGEARRLNPALTLRWQVYGACELPPDNSVAPYEALGFLEPRALADAYRQADILLSASWYESFPLFPLEAMACGLAVITTSAGTEDFARHGETADIVAPRDVRGIAQSITRLATDREYRLKLGAAGRNEAAKFRWPRSVDRMEEILVGGVVLPS